MSKKTAEQIRQARGYPLLRAIATTNRHSRDGIIRHLNDAGQQRISVAIKRQLTSRSFQNKENPENLLLQNIVKPRYKDLKKLAYEFNRYQNAKRKNMLLRSGDAISSILLSVLPEIADSIVTDDERKEKTKKNNVTTSTTPTTKATSIDSGDLGKN